MNTETTTVKQEQEKLIKHIQDYKTEMKKHEDEVEKIARKMHVIQDELRESANKESAGSFQKIKDALRELFPEHSRYFKEEENEIEYVDLSGAHPFSMIQLSKTTEFNTAFYVMIGVNSSISNYIRLVADSRGVDALINEVKELAAKFS